MYFIPAGLLLKLNPEVLADAQIALGSIPDLSRLTVSGFLQCNLLPVTLGNIIGGSFFVGAIYWFVYLRRIAAEPISGTPLVALGSSVND